MNKSKSILLSCYHCGNDVPDNNISLGDKPFCCSGCKMVYEILNEHGLCTFYEMNDRPGIIQDKVKRKDKYAFLEDIVIQKKLIQFSNEHSSQVTFYIPQIHCSSCLWLLENIQKVNPGVISSRVNFTKKEVFIVYNNKLTSLRDVVESLDRIGYEPHLSLNELSARSDIKTGKTRLYKIGVAGFCFANIMMISLADYFDSTGSISPRIALFFKSIIVLLSLPVLFYSASEFFVSAWKGVKNKYLNIDFPVALALVITFIRSIYEINMGIGNGYLDSLSGIVFFMLIGRWLQDRTYQTISFDRDYKSFFPIALNVVKNGCVTPTEICNVKMNDLIQIHSNEIIPVDAILSKGNANIDYSFVSGESIPVKVNIGEMVYAGGKQLDGMLELLVVKEMSQSYLTNLWNNPVFNKRETAKKTDYDTVGKYFTYAVLAIGLIAGIFWYANGETSLMWNALTTVLIVACPCALLLSGNYTNGNILRVLGLNKFYLRSPEIISKLANINHIVLDKTGTLTQAQGSSIRYAGRILPAEFRKLVVSVIKQSSHPVSKLVSSYFNEKDVEQVDNFREIKSAGIEAWIHDHHIKLGSPAFAGGEYFKGNAGTKVVVAIDNVVWGEFIITNKYRFGVTRLIDSLSKEYTLSLLSGDNDAEFKNIEKLLGKASEIYFNQTPQQKLEYIRDIQADDLFKVMMIGDGLNDAGALRQSNVGIAVADTTNNFTPASDAIIDGTQLTKLPSFIRLAKAGKRIIFFSFGISVSYNIIGLYFAVQGILSPVIAAVLMPCSSITIILLAYGLTNIVATRMGIQVNLSNELRLK